MATTAIRDKHMSLKLDADLKEQIEQYANDNELDQSKVVRIALKKFFNQSPVQKTGKKAS
ncbi:MAG: ribbon-helix-helix protein, CopG family [Leptospiraceae bacterium]|nr:ribbon-helix-helix protein, CopG family [Leptospiraceae bacterium]